MASAACGAFSGGEKSRLALALLIWHQPNLLLLDEPTNHLDLEMRHALTMALQDYEGGMVLVSHDRALLRSTCDRFILVADGKAEVFDGDIDDYKDWLAQHQAEQKQAEKAAAGESANSRPEGKNERAQNKADRQARLAERRPLVKESEKLEADMAKWQKEKSLIDEQLADPTLYAAADKSGLQNLLKRQAELSQSIEQAEERWLTLQEQLEAIPT
jgi:ATP-binding cassette subfamily F protein 3